LERSSPPLWTLLPGAFPPFWTLLPGAFPPLWTLLPGVLPPLRTLLPGAFPPLWTLLPGAFPPLWTLLPGVVPPHWTLRVLNHGRHRGHQSSCLAVLEAVSAAVEATTELRSLRPPSRPPGVLSPARPPLELLQEFSQVDVFKTPVLAESRSRLQSARSPASLTRARRNVASCLSNISTTLR
jgi:hypothetical protein